MHKAKQIVGGIIHTIRYPWMHDFDGVKEMVSEIVSAIGWAAIFVTLCLW